MGELEKIVDIPKNIEEAKLALALLLDRSSSMSNKIGNREKIEELNEGLKALKDALMGDDKTRKRVEIAVITFGGYSEVNTTDFLSVEDFEPQELEANGNTPMGAAILQGIKTVNKWKKTYWDIGITYYKPRIWLLTDGEPTDMRVGDDLWNKVTKEVNEGEKVNHFTFCTMGVEGANVELLKKLSHRDEISKVREAFDGWEWLLFSIRRSCPYHDGKELEQLELEETPKWGNLNVQNPPDG